MKKKIKGEKRPSAGVKDAALRLLSFRAHAERELRRKLVKRGFSAEEITATTEELKKLGYLDDLVFSKTLALSRSRNKNWGSLKIAAELRNKGVEANVVKEAVDELGPEKENASAKNAFEKWMTARRGGARAKRGPRQRRKDELIRAIRHLCARGFSPPVARSAAASISGGSSKERFIDDSE